MCFLGSCSQVEYWLPFRQWSHPCNCVTISPCASMLERTMRCIESTLTAPWNSLDCRMQVDLGQCDRCRGTAVTVFVYHVHHTSVSQQQHIGLQTRHLHTARHETRKSGGYNMPFLECDDASLSQQQRPRLSEPAIYPYHRLDRCAFFLSFILRFATFASTLSSDARA